jgi:hypothetical protein
LDTPGEINPTLDGSFLSTGPGKLVSVVMPDKVGCCGSNQ